MKALPFSQVINKGVQQLSSLQEKDGSFLSFSSPDEQNFKNATSYHTTFLSCFILLETAFLPITTNISYMRNKIAAFLLLHKSAYWSWNYWQRNSKEAKKLPYPDDLDVTFCALAALFHYDKKLITADVFAYVVHLLTATEKKEGGPYRTWLVEKNAPAVWQDIDIAVNSNIAYFLSLHDISLAPLDVYIEKQIVDKKLVSPYYPSFYAPLYFLSRFYKGKHNKMLIDFLLKERDKNSIWQNPLKTALAALTLFNLGLPAEKLEKSIAYLLTTQTNGLWQAYGFSIDPSKNGKQYFAGSSALTTVFCLRAVHQYYVLQEGNKQKKHIVLKNDDESTKYYEMIIKKVEAYYLTQGETIYDKGKLLLHKIITGDKGRQIPLLSYYFFRALRKKHKAITKQLLITLGVANILGWIAYTVFDDFFDEEGDSSFLPLAIVSLRQLTNIFDTFILRKKRIQKLYHTLMDTVDMANAEELRRRSLTNYYFDKKDVDHLADKSIGHALGPLAIIILLGYTQESKEFKNMLLFFNHYLVAKQLNDDAHDWEEDLQKKRITPVVALILTRARERKIRKTRRNLQEFFWKEIIQEICELIHQHARKAKMALKQSTLIADPTYLETLLEAPVQAAAKALEEQKNVKAFLKTYQA